MNPGLIVLAVVLAVLIGTGLHKVDEGFVGVYWRGGALLNSITGPGFHVKFPMLTSYAQVQISVQTDKVTEIPCGTSGGVLVHFEAIEVVNRLNASHVLDTVRKYGLDYDKIWIFDKIHHEINQFCSSHTLQEVYVDLFDTLDEALSAALQEDCAKWAPGIEIVATRVTKPRIPPAIMSRFEEQEAEKTKLLITIERQKVFEKEADTERVQSLIQAEKRAEVSKIQNEKDLTEKRANQVIQRLEDSIHIARQKAQTDALFYKQERIAAANKLKLTPEYLQVEAYRALRNQPKLYFGERLTDMFGGDWANTTLSGSKKKST